MLGSNVSPAELARWQARVEPGPRWLEFDAAEVQRHYNRLPFLLRHRLHEHPAFDFPALRALCLRLPENAVRRRQGVVPDHVHFDSSLPTYATEIGIGEAFDRLQERQLYIAVYNPETDPEYREIIEGLLGEIALAIQPFGTPINWYSTYLFVSAHDAVTPYHMDREMNFLLQVRGRKQVQLWDPNDDRVMSPAQRDHLFSYDEDSRPRWRPELDALALRYELQPGLGVHHPFIAPHLVHTGPDPSISLAITFRTPESDRWTNAHRFNEHLRRRLGWSGRSVGRSRPVDIAKSLALDTLARVRKALR